jgi:hypothetical protein
MIPVFTLINRIEIEKLVDLVSMGLKYYLKASSLVFDSDIISSIHKQQYQAHST